MLYQAEITLHCIIDLFKGYLPSFKKSFYKLHAAEHTLSRTLSHNDLFRRDLRPDERNRKSGRANTGLFI